MMRQMKLGDFIKINHVKDFINSNSNEDYQLLLF